MEHFASIYDATKQYIEEMREAYGGSAVEFPDPGDPNDFVEMFNAIAQIWYNMVPNKDKATKIPELSTDYVTVADAFYRMIEVLTWAGGLPNLLPEPPIVAP